MKHQRPSTGGGTPATAVLEAAGVRYLLHSYQHQAAASSYGVEAAQALGVPAQRVFKTLMVSVTGMNAAESSPAPGERGEQLVAAVVPVSDSLDLKALASALGAKRAELADPLLAQRRTGYVLGGISPLGGKFPHPTVLDESALGFPTIFCSAGRRGLEVEIAPATLLHLTQAVSATIRTNPLGTA